MDVKKSTNVEQSEPSQNPEKPINSIDEEDSVISDEDLNKITNSTSKVDIESEKISDAKTTAQEKNEKHLSTNEEKKSNTGKLKVPNRLAVRDGSEPKEEQNGQHQRLQTTESPCISTCTTATNLSSLGDFQSNSTINFQRKLNKEDNLRMAIPEIEPLQKKTEVEIQDEPSEGLSFRKIFNQVSFHTLVLQLQCH
nr:unnamed protein product [Callosobruchus analis]